MLTESRVLMASTATRTGRMQLRNVQHKGLEVLTLVASARWSRAGLLLQAFRAVSVLGALAWELSTLTEEIVESTS